MTLLRIQPIVEGHGEVEAVPLLLRRIFGELHGAYDIDVLSPLRQPRSLLMRAKDLLRFVQLGANKLRARSPAAPGLVLLLLDGDGDPPCELGPALLQHVRAAAGEQASSCVIANHEFETWFVAAATSLTPYLHVVANDVPLDPERHPARKKWIEDRFRGPKYSETLDQPKLTAKMDLALCRERSPSFDKLCRDLARELEAARRAPAPPDPAEPPTNMSPQPYSPARPRVVSPPRPR